MKSLRERMGFLKKIIPLFVCVSFTLVPFSAAALNTDLVDSEVYWIDKGTQINYGKDDYFEGFSKYIIDENEGCFYLFTRFTDYRIDRYSQENITLAFTIENGINSYYFQVNKDGVTNSSSPNTFDAIDIYYNFNEASCKKQGGGIFIALKLKNETDRRLKNLISCEYFCGYDCTYDLFESIYLDMYVPTTAKTTTQKTTKQTAKQTTEATTGKTTTAPKATKESSTKFSGSGLNSSASSSNSTKFSGSKTAAYISESNIDQQQSATTSSNSISQGEIQMNDNNENPEENSQSSRLSQQAKILLAVFAVLFSCGIICIVIGTVNGKREENQNISENE